ncbi:MAG: uvrD2 [Ilumatobacteraceae bacterium]|nr:uvrD2 [Ilumatobacteraceae bacterium]
MGREGEHGMTAVRDDELRLLLPQLLRGLDPQQRLAVTTDAAPLAIVAAAGSGKTTVLTRRIARRLADGSAEARHVLALTFTRDAAGELRRRLRRLDVRETVESGTFHAVALRLLRDRALTTGTSAPVVASDRHRLVREVLTETRLRRDPTLVIADLDWARVRLVAPDQFGDANRKARRRSALDAETFVAVFDAYTALKRRRGVVDFDDLLANVLLHMQRDVTFAEVVRWRFRHLFVDEAQDLNPLQFAVLDQIRDGRPDICLVGDHRQAIYGWNGADPSTLLEVEQRFPGVTVVALTGNYRCSPQIVRTGAAALQSAAIDDDTESKRPDGRRPIFVAADDDLDEAAKVAAVVRDLVQRHGPREVAVLARTNDQLQGLGKALTAAHVPIIRSAGSSPLERALTEAGRSRTRDQLAAWAEAVWTGDASDPVRRRVAEEVDRFLSSNEPGSFRTWVEARQPFDDLEPDDDGAVSLLTFHAAKGREWRAVVVTGVEQGLVPHASSGAVAQRAEEARLLYVAVTRAGDELVVTWAQRRGGSTTGPSQWIDGLREAVPDHAAVAVPDSLRTRRPLIDPLVALRAWRTDVARTAGTTESAVCSDRVLRSLLDHPPADAAELAVRLGVSPSVAERWADRLLTPAPTARPA